MLFDGVGNEFQQTVDMRGFNAQPVTATSVFVDGVRVNEPDFNTINFDLIPIEDIERIEILPGTATVFGRNALAGVINITTKRGRKDRPHIGFEHRRRQLRQAEIFVQHRWSAADDPQL